MILGSKHPRWSVNLARLLRPLLRSIAAAGRAAKKKLGGDSVPRPGRRLSFPIQSSPPVFSNRFCSGSSSSLMVFQFRRPRQLERSIRSCLTWQLFKCQRRTTNLSQCSIQHCQIQVHHAAEPRHVMGCLPEGSFEDLKRRGASHGKRVRVSSVKLVAHKCHLASACSCAAARLSLPNKASFCEGRVNCQARAAKIFA